MFENITDNFQINSMYIVIGLIIVALVCIYLLYTSLTSGNYYNDLKKNINELIVQNKKRDEIIHFLVNQVQMQQSEMPIKEVGGVENNEDSTEDPTATHPHLENIEINDDDMLRLDELLDEGFTSEPNTLVTNTPTQLTPVVNSNMETNNDITAEDNIEEKVDDVVEEEESEDEQEETDDEVVLSVLNSSVDSKSLPKDKVKLSIFTVADLREHAKNLNVSTSGNKSTLINRIYEAL